MSCKNAEKEIILSKVFFQDEAEYLTAYKILMGKFKANKKINKTRDKFTKHHL
jgi:hypothetical protein